MFGIGVPELIVLSILLLIALPFIVLGIHAKASESEEPSESEDKSVVSKNLKEEKMANRMIYCRQCGKEIHDSAVSCPHCGAAQKSQGKSKVVAGLLAIFLGGIGIHRFYLGQWRGLIYLLLSWTFIPALISFIEGIVFLLTRDDVWNAKYGGTR